MKKNIKNDPVLKLFELNITRHPFVQVWLKPPLPLKTDHKTASSQLFRTDPCFSSLLRVGNSGKHKRLILGSATSMVYFSCAAKDQQQRSLDKKRTGTCLCARVRTLQGVGAHVLLYLPRHFTNANGETSSSVLWTSFHRLVFYSTIPIKFWNFPLRKLCETSFVFA